MVRHDDQVFTIAPVAKRTLFVASPHPLMMTVSMVTVDSPPPILKAKDLVLSTEIKLCSLNCKQTIYFFPESLIWISHKGYTHKIILTCTHIHTEMLLSLSLWLINNKITAGCIYNPPPQKKNTPNNNQNKNPHTANISHVCPGMVSIWSTSYLLSRQALTQWAGTHSVGRHLLRENEDVS